MSKNPLGQREFSEAHATNFQVYIKELPSIEFYLTDSFLPSVNLNTFEVPHGDFDIQMSDNKMTYDPITISFLVDEYFQSYIEILEWMKKVANPQGEREEDVPVFDLYMTVQDNNKQSIITFKYISARPMSLEQVVFDHQDEGNTVLTSAVTLQFDYMTWVKHYEPIPTSL